jgi:hypothetical protein
VTRGAGAWLLVAWASGFGCVSSSEPPPSTCVGDCGLPPDIGVGLPPPNGSAGAGDTGDTDAGTSQGVVLTGNVLILNDDLNFSTGALFTDAVDIKTDGANGIAVTGTWDGSDPFVIQGVQEAAPVWVSATPESATADDALPALEPVSTDSPDATNRVSVSLGLVHASTIDHIFDLSSVPLTADPTLAQVILLLVSQASGAGTPPPLPGITVTAPSAQNVLYGASGSFSDIATATDATGVVVLANLPATAWPGALVSLEFSGARTSGTQVRAVTGAVTLATIAP